MKTINNVKITGSNTNIYKGKQCDNNQEWKGFMSIEWGNVIVAMEVLY